MDNMEPILIPLWSPLTTVMHFVCKDMAIVVNLM